MTRLPRLASSRHTPTRPASKNCASSMPTTWASSAKSKRLADDSTGVDGSMLLSCETTSASE